MSVMEQFYVECPWWQVDANTAFIIEAVGRQPLTLKNLEAVANRLDSEGRLLLAKDYATAWENFLRRRPEFSNVVANKLVAFRSIDSYALPSAELFEELGDRQNSPLAKNAIYHEQQADVAERAKLIAEIVNGRKTFIVRTNTGQRIEYDAAGRRVEFSSSGGRAANNAGGFEDMTLDQIRELNAVVLEQRRLDSLSPEELKKHINEARQQRYEDSSYSVRTAQQPLTDSQGRAVTEPTLAAKTQQYVLRHPETGEQFTDKRSVIRYINSETNAARKLLTFPDGRSRPGAKEALEALLRGNV